MLSRLIHIFLLSLLLVQSAHAAMITESGGIMTGATGIEVKGILYDVSFKDGTCVSLFDGCDQTSDFPFDVSTSSLAMGALKTIIESTIYTNRPRGFTGCTSPVVSALCYLLNPHSFVSSNEVKGTFLQINLFTAPRLVESSITITNDTTTNVTATYALWTPQPSSTIPEPSSLLLIGMGLLGQRLLRSRSKRLQV